VSIYPDISWTLAGQPAASLYFSAFPESVLDDDYYAPNVGLEINPDWEDRDALIAILRAQGLPPGFVSTYDSDGTTDPDCPFWKPLPLPDFQSDGGFDLQRFVKEIVAAFECLAAVRPIVDGYLREHTPPRPLVPEIRKALVLDIETWGAGDPDTDEIVEAGLILAAYDAGSGGLLGVLDRYGELRDPGRRATAAPSGRLTRQMVAGKSLDNDRVEALVGQASVIISHNIGFDKPRFERLISIQQIPALALLVAGSALGQLRLGSSQSRISM
jgi:hypothetical protein